MLSGLTLSFRDPELKRIYTREKTEFFKKSAPTVAAMLLLLTITLEIMYRGADMGTLPSYISVVNGVILFLMIIIACLHSRLTFLNKAVCPCLTVLVFLYLSFVDYDYTLGSIYYS